MTLTLFSPLFRPLFPPLPARPLQIPKFDFISNARPSLYAYPPALKVKEKEEAKPIATAVLSTTAKANARAQEKKKEKDCEAMDTVRLAGLLTPSPPPRAPLSISLMLSLRSLCPPSLCSAI